MFSRQLCPDHHELLCLIVGIVVCLMHNTQFCTVHPCNSRFTYAHCKGIRRALKYSFIRVTKSINTGFPVTSLPSTYLLLAFAPPPARPPIVLFFHLCFSSRFIIAFDRREVCSTGRVGQVGRLEPASPVLYIALTRM
jgi:hypothetical protein